MSPRTPPPPSGPPTADDVQRHCQRVRAAGSPNARARTTLVADYRRLALALGLEPEETPTGLDLQRASAALLRAAALNEAAATRRPGAPHRAA